MMLRQFIQLILFSLLIVSSVFAQKEKDTTLIVYFDNNQFALNKIEQARLDSFFINSRYLIIKNISGFTDTVGSTKSNILLSKKRSLSIARYFKKNTQFNQDYSVKYFGESNTVSQTDNFLNRRVEISIQVVTPHADSVKKSPQPAIIKKLVLDKLYFKPDLAILEGYSLDYLKKVVAILKNYTNARFEIRGHVNCPLNVPAGSGYMNAMNKLSDDRARVVYEILSDNGIPKEKMTYRGMGNSEMINPYARTEDEARKNMRVEIFIMQDD